MIFAKVKSGIPLFPRLTAAFVMAFVLQFSSKAAIVWPPDTCRCSQWHKDFVDSNSFLSHNTTVKVTHNGGNGTVSFTTFLDQAGKTDSVTYIIAASSQPYAVGCRSVTIGTYAGAKRRCIAIRGETGTRSDVVIVGADPAVAPDYWKSSQYGGPSTCGSYQFLQLYNVEHMVIADLTMRNFPGHMIKLDGGFDNGTAWYPRDIVLHNLELHDCGDQLIKGASNSDSSPLGCVDGILECSYLHYTDGLFPQSSYETQGIDLHEGHNWKIRDNFFERLRIDKNTTAGHASNSAGVLIWDRSDSILVERNCFLNCDAAIKLGATWYLDTCDYMTAINNLVIYNDTDSRYTVSNMFEIGLDVTNGGIFHTTIWNPAQSTSGTVVYCPNNTFPFRNNLFYHGSLHRAAGAANNVQIADSSWFVGTGLSDFHCKQNHTVPAVAAVIEDMEGKARSSTTPTAGAFEFNANPLKQGLNRQQDDFAKAYTVRYERKSRSIFISSRNTASSLAEKIAVYTIRGQNTGSFGQPQPHGFMLDVKNAGDGLLIVKIDKENKPCVIPVSITH
jgi:hypothetical protein